MGKNSIVLVAQYSKYSSHVGIKYAVSSHTILLE